MERKSLVVSQGNTWKHAFRRDTGSPRPFLRARRGKRWAEAHSTTARGSAAGRPRGTSWSPWLEEECGTNFNRKPLPTRKGRAPWGRAHGGRDLVLAFAREQHYKHRRPPREVTCPESLQGARPEFP